MTIKSMPTTQKYRDNYDRIFKKECPQCHAPTPIHKLDCSEPVSRQAPVEKFPTKI